MNKNAPSWLAWATLSGLFLLGATWAALRGAAMTATAHQTAATAPNPGDVVINEVAWMGTAANYSDEWMELYNTTDSSITLTDWTLTASDGSPAITLQGVIPPRGYFLLERSDDDTISDIPADQVYSGALENDPSAESLSLRDEVGTLIDSVNADGGPWPAGDNASKRTMERVDPGAAGGDNNWADNDSITRNGQDANGDPIYGTPKARNSAYIGPTPAEADLVVFKSGPATAQPGGTISYTIHLSNNGALTASAVTLTDRLPSAVTFDTQSSALPFYRNGELLSWEVGDMAPYSTGAPALTITVTGRISATFSGPTANVVTATTETTETLIANNRATWETKVSGGSVLIAALLYDGYQTNDQDEAVQLINVGDAPADLTGWRVCDAADNGTCVTIPGGTLAANDTLWLAYWASDFYTSSGFYPAYAVKGLAPETAPLSGTWPRFANAGEQVVLRDASDSVIDTLVYAGGDANTPGWSGTAIEPWTGDGQFAAEGQILYRMLDEETGLPVPDTNTLGDWAQCAGDPLYGRRVRYPGWDLEAFYRPLSATEEARVTVGIAPDNAADVVLEAIEAAESQIEIAIYSLRHPTVIAELVKKASAGVSVTVLFEGDPAGVPKTDPRWYQQMWACQQLYDTGHGACWFMINDDPANIYDRYRYMHAKYILVDRASVLITSQNLTASGMPDDDRSNGTHGSRGVALLTDAPSVVQRVAQIFERDLDPAHHGDLLAWLPTGSEYGPPSLDFVPTLSVTDYTTYTVIFSQSLRVEGMYEFELFTAPEAALRQRDALLGLLARAGDGDQVYVEGLDERAHWGEDPSTAPSPRMEAYIAAARRGARVRILLNNGVFDAEYIDASSNIAAVAYANKVARQEGLDLIASCGDPTQYGIHNKMVLVWLNGTGGYVHVGSLNGSESSNKVNRELALQLRSDEVYAYLKGVFDWDWYTSNPLFLPLLTREWRAPAPPVDYPVISEVLYDPAGAEEGDEWVEIYNPTERAVDLANWYLGDVDLGGEYGSGLYTFPPDTALPAGGVLLIARQARDVLSFKPDLEFLIDPLRDDPAVPNMVPAGNWAGFGFALGNTGDEVLLLDATGVPVDALTYGAGSYPGVLPHPGVSAPGHSLERRPAIYDSDDCSQDFFDRYPPDPGDVSP